MLNIFIILLFKLFVRISLMLMPIFTIIPLLKKENICVVNPRIVYIYDIHFLLVTIVVELTNLKIARNYLLAKTI